MRNEKNKSITIKMSMMKKRPVLYTWALPIYLVIVEATSEVPVMGNE